jgi:hypothetical protein
VSPHRRSPRTAPTEGRSRALRRALPLAGIWLVGTAAPAHAHDPPAGGASGEEVVISSVVAALFLLVVAGAVVARRRGGLASLDRLAAFSGRVGRLPGWAALPIAIASVSLIVAVVGFYWDVATHIDHGRDEGIFGNVAHWPILVGLVGLTLAGLVAVMLGTDDERSGWEPRPGWRISVGGSLLLLCGLVAMAGFPIDDVWHRIFGQDVTLWSPPHVQMVLGASLCTLALWVLFVEAERSSPRTGANRRLRYLQEAGLAGAVLIGMSTLQGEFDFGVPQFRLLYQPLLIAVAAGIALVPARMRLGRGGALVAVGVFLALRGAITLFVTGVMDHLTFHFPLYLGAALVVELVARVVPTHRELSLGAWVGLGIGTVGLATEAVWSHLWMPVPWSAALLPEVVLLGVPAAVAAGVTGGLLGRALTDPGTPRQPAPRGLAVAAGLVLLAALSYPMPTTGIDAEAELTLDHTGGDRAHVTARIDPPELAEDAEWVHVISWQGAEWHGDEHTLLVPLRPSGEGVWRTPEPVPVAGDWKTMLRVHQGRIMAAAPIYLPEDTAIPAGEVPAEPETSRSFVPDEEVLLREMRDAPAWIEGVAHGGMALIGAGWLAAFVLGARHLRRTRPEDEDVDVATRATAARVD